MKPYKDIAGFRIFDDDIDPIELKQHRDLENRIIISTDITDWKFQFDNELPINIDVIYIPKLSQHRLIKGSGILKLKIFEFSEISDGVQILNENGYSEQINKILKLK